MDYNSSGSYFLISMSAKSFAAVNVPLSATGILLNVFFVFCMIFPPQGAELLKPLLKVLLGSLVGCNTAIHVCGCLIVYYVFVIHDVILDWLALVISGLIVNVMMYTMMTSVTCCQWMNMFYFCQIVPPQHPFFIWFKKNIRALIYSGLIFNVVLYVFGMTADVAYAIVQVKFYNADNVSSAMRNELVNSVALNHDIKLVNFLSRVLLFLLSVCVMLVSSFATVLYLWRHMKNLEESGVSSPRLQRQIKVIITSILIQATLNFLCSVGVLIDEILSEYTGVDSDGLILFTIISLYSFGTTINMGITQSLFRQGAVNVLQKLQ
ncbi:taste receptor type 2 member 8-like [Astyanax mexicanus]|uniref:taste receptor type 2 member 8-like n=1 Tax=Astyanax mexicanus TaxID=7994 RepID=UPI0020CB039A|nr:taste receptor type 2 member 8-like [Astyanax mexicanus]